MLGGSPVSLERESAILGPSPSPLAKDAAKALMLRTHDRVSAVKRRIIGRMTAKSATVQCRELLIDLRCHRLVHQPPTRACTYIWHTTSWLCADRTPLHCAGRKPRY